MLLNKDNFSLHRTWIVVFIIGTIATLVCLIDFSEMRLRFPGGSSAPGIVIGTLAAVIIVFELLLWPRKKLARRWRIGRVRSWMCAHIWLGLLTVPLALAHGGLSWGGALAIALMVCLFAVVLSGIFGFVLQQFLPRMMKDAVPGETVISQIECVARQYLAEADALIAATCGTGVFDTGVEFWSHLEQGGLDHTHDSGRVVGAHRSIAAAKGTALITDLPKQPVPKSILLDRAYQATIRDYLQFGGRSKSILKYGNRSTEYFRDLRKRIPAEAQPALTALENWCNQRRQFELQARLHWWLHSWLAIHLPVSLALLILLIWHIVVALKYSGVFSAF